MKNFYSFLLFFAVLLFYSQTITTFSTSSTWAAPAGVTSIKVEVWGAGAGGSNNANRGGGGGAFAGNNTLTVTPGFTYAINVGVGGAPAGNGQDSSFGSLVVAKGAVGATGGSAAASTGTIKYDGGNGGSSTGTGGAGGGGSAGSNNAGGTGGNSSSSWGGVGGAAGAGGGAGGNGGNSTGGGLNGAVPGGGGGENGASGPGSGSGGNGRVIITYVLPCTTPRAPSAASFSSVTSSGLSLNFTPPAPAPSGGYVVFRSTTATAPVLTNGTAYATGNSYTLSTASYMVVSNGAATTIAQAGLTPNTRYYYHVFSQNTSCTGQPFYSTGVSDSQITCAAAPTANTVSDITLNRAIVNWKASSTGGGVALSNYTLQVSTTNTFSTQIAGSPFSTGTNTSKSLTGLSPNTTYYYRIRANNGCDSEWLTGNFSTMCVPSSGTLTTRYISEVKFMGTLVADKSQLSGYSSSGYADYTSVPDMAKQIPGAVVNMNIKLAGSSNPPTGIVKCWVDWNKDGIFDENIEKEYDTAGFLSPNVLFGFIIPQSTRVGVYTLRVRAGASVSSPCGNETNTETEDYTFEVVADCPATITRVINGERCGPGSVTLSAVGSSGTTSYLWYKDEFGPAISGQTSSSFTTENLSEDAVFYVKALNSTCESSARVPVRVHVRPVPRITFSQNSPNFCGSANTVIISSTGNKEEVTLLEENFGSGELTLGKFKNDAINTYSASHWIPRSNPFKPDAPYNVIKVALSSGYNNGNFATAITDVNQTSNITNHLVVSEPLNTVGVSNLRIDYDLYYFAEEDNKPDRNRLSLEYSTNDIDWYPLKTYSSTVGVPSRFARQSIADDVLQPKLENKSNLKVRFSIFAYGSSNEWIGTVAAIDNIRIYGEKELPAKFTWSSSDGQLFSADCSTPLDSSGTPSVCIKLNSSELEDKSIISVVATSTLTNGCSTSGTFTVNNNSKIWNSSSNDWSTTNWKPDPTVPSADKCVIVKQPVIINSTTKGLAKNITVEPSGALQISGSLKVTDFVKNYAEPSAVVIESNASLIQVNEGNTINVGNITAKRTVNVSAGRQQYNYLISPLEGQSLKTVYAGIEYVLYHNEANNFFYNSTGAYIKGRALAVKEPKLSALPDQKSTSVTATFTGYPTNGAFTYNLVNSNTASPKRGYNLVGNPYPSNMDLSQFYHINRLSGNISNSFNLWDNRANSQTVQMGDKYEGQAYAVFHATTPPGEGTGTLATGDKDMAGTVRPTRYIKMGQGFMVKTRVNNQALIFNNTVRTDKDGSAYFGRTPGDSVNFDRFWLNMITPTSLRSEMAVVYFEGGTNGFSSDDAASLGGSDELYSRVDERKVNINGRSIFTDEDVVPLGTRHFTTGEYRIELAGTDGIFSYAQPVYLKDKLTGAITNLSESAYSFAAEAGESTGRFEIVYKPGGTLATDAGLKESVVVYRDKNDFHIRSDKRNITGLQLFDSSGRLVYSAKPNAAETLIDANPLPNGVYFLRIERGFDVVSKKIIR